MGGGTPVTLDQAASLAASCQAVGDFPRADRLCRVILASAPAHAGALGRLAALCRMDGARSDDAFALATRAARLGCDVLEVWAILAAGTPIPARRVAAARHLVAIDPAAVEHWSALALALIQTGEAEAGLAVLTVAGRLRPGDITVLLHRALALLHRNRLAEAETVCAQGLGVSPLYPPMLARLAQIRTAQMRMDEAFLYLAQALALGGNSPDTLLPMGQALLMVGQPYSGTECLSRLTAQAPRMVEGWSWLGRGLLQLGRIGAALAAYRRALALNPDDAATASALAFSLNYDPDQTEETVAAVHRDWGLRYHGRTPVMPPVPAAPGGDMGRPLRIGYVSADLGNHPVGRLLDAVLTHRPAGGSVALLYDAAPRTGAQAEHLRTVADGWCNAAVLSDAALADRIRADRIDILVDLSGHTGGHRLGVFARRPAPVQASWLGYFHSTGLPAMDYVILDHHTAPPEAELLYTERIVRLPHSRFCYTPLPDCPPVAPLPSAAGGPVTFGSFNILTKLNEAVVALWAQVLHAVPGSRLVLKALTIADPEVQRDLLQRFRGHGIEGPRLVLRGASGYREMMAEYGDIDIALDPFPFTGGMTSLDSLWMGVPVVTWPGRRPVSRQSLSFLAVLGLDRLAAASGPQDYVARAVALAADRGRLAALRAGLRPAMQASPLCDGSGFAARLDGAFRGMWARHTAGHRPAAFAVGADGSPAGEENWP